MQRITREQARKYAFDWRDEPTLRVRPGEAFEVETWDASTGYFKTPADKAIPALRPGFDRNPPLVNPIGGPVYLEGAQRGDTLVVTVEDITVGDYSWIAVGPKPARPRCSPGGASIERPRAESSKIRPPLPPRAGPATVGKYAGVAESADASDLRRLSTGAGNPPREFSRTRGNRSTSPTGGWRQSRAKPRPTAHAGEGVETWRLRPTAAAPRPRESPDHKPPPRPPPEGQRGG